MLGNKHKHNWAQPKRKSNILEIHLRVRTVKSLTLAKTSYYAMLSRNDLIVWVSSDRNLLHGANIFAKFRKHQCKIATRRERGGWRRRGRGRERKRAWARARAREQLRPSVYNNTPGIHKAKRVIENLVTGILMAMGVRSRHGWRQNVAYYIRTKVAQARKGAILCYYGHWSSTCAHTRNELRHVSETF